MIKLDSIGRRNGMFNMEISKKVHATLRKKYPNWGKFNIGRKRPDLSERNRKNIKRGKKHPCWTEGYIKKCKFCNKEFRISECFKEQKFCNKNCYTEYLRTYGHSEKVMDAIRKNRQHQKFPKKNSSIEVKIQDFLKQLGVEFFTHQYIKEIEHSYQCDILIPSKKLIIECDGDYWHGNPKKYSDEGLTERILRQRELDKIRTKELIGKGFRVLRLWECQIKNMELNEFSSKLK